MKQTGIWGWSKENPIDKYWLEHGKLGCFLAEG